MNNWHLYDKAPVLIPFNLRGFNGQVAVYYGINDDPTKAGFDFLPGLGFDIDLCRGYPAIHARIESYAGSGYRTYCGWVQILTSVYLNSHDKQKAQTKTLFFVDMGPAFLDSDVPFVSYGNFPEVFDAPCYNLGENAELTWIADTFLTTIPTRSRAEEISWLLGFRWGYIENDIPDEKPVLLPLEVTDAQVWNKHIPFLMQEYSNWRFKRE